MEHLFSYGTLQLENVQLSTFGRSLKGTPDVLHGFSLEMIAIEDAEIVSTSGATHHPIAKFSGAESDRVEGTLFLITVEELQHADNYEVDNYKRVTVKLASGISAWVYLDKRYAPQLT
ncbi:MAG: gamma-glutamylcyclotransferase [Gammaproteobacteria bacterium]|nr:MAG: gamma-glutamylcyclotransferase [Gammaproteobacteria bacterium]